MTFDVWLRDLTEDGDVEPNPGPPRNQIERAGEVGEFVVKFFADASSNRAEREGAAPQPDRARRRVGGRNQTAQEEGGGYC